MPRTNRPPSYRLHKATGQAVVTIDARDHYLGRYDSAESRAEYDRLIAEWLANGRQLPASDFTIRGSAESFDQFSTRSAISRLVAGCTARERLEREQATVVGDDLAGRGHYDSMIAEGSPQAIEWPKEQSSRDSLLEFP